MSIIKDVSPKIRAQKYAKELGWGKFVEYCEVEKVHRENVAGLRQQTDGPVNPEKRDIDDVAAFTLELKEKALELGADLVGVCEVKQEYVYANRSASEKFVICLAIHMDYKKIKKAPNKDDVSIECWRVYELLAGVAVSLAGHIREQGYPARAQVVGKYDIMLIPHALSAGLGEQCRIGTLASADFGPCMRLAAVVTDAPLMADQPVDLGVRAVCDECDICIKACPGGAIPEKQTMTRGDEKWTLDPVKCMRWLYYNPEGCTICLKVCPLSDVNKIQP